MLTGCRFSVGHAQICMLAEIPPTRRSQTFVRKEKPVGLFGVCIQLPVLTRFHTLLHTAYPKLYIHNTHTQTVHTRVGMAAALFHTAQNTLPGVFTVPRRFLRRSSVKNTPGSESRRWTAAVLAPTSPILVALHKLSAIFCPSKNIKKSSFIDIFLEFCSQHYK